MVLFAAMVAVGRNDNHVDVAGVWAASEGCDGLASGPIGEVRGRAISVDEFAPQLFVAGTGSFEEFAPDFGELIGYGCDF